MVIAVTSIICATVIFVAVFVALTVKHIIIEKEVFVNDRLEADRALAKQKLAHEKELANKVPEKASEAESAQLLKALADPLAFFDEQEGNK